MSSPTRITLTTSTVKSKSSSHAPASANYLIARDGTVYRLVPEDRVAWHAGKGHLPWEPALESMNQQSIGIENFAIGSPADMKLFGMTQAQYDSFKTKHPDWVGFSDAQYAALNQLIDQIRSRHPAILPTASTSSATKNGPDAPGAPTPANSSIGRALA